jgi:hypothetical protein
MVTSVDMRRVVMVALGLALARCATPYQPISSRGGYFDHQTRPSIHFVLFAANGFTNLQTVRDYWQRRVEEICGLRRLVVLSAEDGTFARPVHGTYGASSMATFPVKHGYVRCVDPAAPEAKTSTAGVARSGS